MVKNSACNLLVSAHKHCFKQKYDKCFMENYFPLRKPTSCDPQSIIQTDATAILSEPESEKPLFLNSVSTQKFENFPSPFFPYSRFFLRLGTQKRRAFEFD